MEGEKTQVFISNNFYLSTVPNSGNEDIHGLLKDNLEKRDENTQNSIKNNKSD